MLIQAQESAAFLKPYLTDTPVAGIILGTGLHRLAKSIQIEKVIPYSEIPHFPLSTVESHAGQLLIGRIAGKQVVAMQGRFHFYEGYTMQQVSFPVRVMKLLGVETLLISNAAGALNPVFKKGELMLLNDHINFQGENPLIGKNIDELGPRFPDMSAPYDAGLLQMAREIAAAHQLKVHEGVYVAVPGPMLETRAEYRFLRIIGADAVGMSTVPEVITARHMNMRCLAVSVLTDECDPDNLHPVTLEEIIAVAATADEKLSTLFKKIVDGL
jgi:purine-nucleoside phosphorylase